MSEENIENYEFDENTDFSAEHDKFMLDTIKSYKDDIEKYSLEIERGDNSVSTYALLFQAYSGLYKFTENEKKYKCVNKDVVDSICANLLAKVNDEIEQGRDLPSNYCRLAEISDYKKDKNRALEYYNMAVNEDESFISARAEYKNYALNDKDGALADLNRALELTQDAQEREYLQFQIDHIDVIRNSDKAIRSTNIQIFIYIAVIIGVIIYVFGDLIYQIYKIFVK